MPMTDVPSPAAPAPNGAGASPREASPAATVLIVDDSPTDRRLASAIAARRVGLRVISAAEGREALEMIAGAPVAAVVTDLQMPGMDGLELVREVRRLHPAIPVILMTGHGSEDIAIQALRAGAANYVPKKALARELVETLNAVLTLAAVDLRRKNLSRCHESSRSNYRLDNDPGLIAPLVSLLQESLEGLGLCDDTGRTRVGVALQEALANALYHGNLEVSSDLRQEDERLFHAQAEARRHEPAYAARGIHVTAEFDRSAATIRIRDEGPGFNTASLDAPFDPESLMRVGGRGMLLIRSFMDEVRHNDAGNEITMVKRRQGR